MVVIEISDEKLLFTDEEYGRRRLIIPEDEAAEFEAQARRRWKKENRKLHIPNLNNRAEVAELRKRLQRKTSSDPEKEEDGEVRDFVYGCGVCGNMDENHDDRECPWLDKLPPHKTVVGPYYDIVCIGCGQIGELCCSKRGSKRGYAVLKSCIFCQTAGHWPWECLTGPKIPGLTEELVEEVISFEPPCKTVLFSQQLHFRQVLLEKDDDDDDEDDDDDDEDEDNVLKEVMEEDDEDGLKKFEEEDDDNVSEEVTKEDEDVMKEVKEEEGGDQAMVVIENIPEHKTDEKLYFTDEEYARRRLIIPEDEAAEFEAQARRRWKKENRKLHIPNLNNRAEVAELRKRLQRKRSSDPEKEEDGEVRDYEYGCGVCGNMDENHDDRECPWLDNLPPHKTVVGPYYDIVCVCCGQIGELCCSKRGSKRGYAVLKSCIFCQAAGHWPWECLTGPKIPGLTEELVEVISLEPSCKNMEEYEVVFEDATYTKEDGAQGGYSIRDTHRPWECPKDPKIPGLSEMFIKAVLSCKNMEGDEDEEDGAQGGNESSKQSWSKKKTGEVLLNPGNVAKKRRIDFEVDGVASLAGWIAIESKESVEPQDQDMDPMMQQNPDLGFG